MLGQTITVKFTDGTERNFRNVTKVHTYRNPRATDFTMINLGIVSTLHGDSAKFPLDKVADYYPTAEETKKQKSFEV